MNKELKQRWIEALRSGNYKQGRFCLRVKRYDSFCCLGVLADLIDPNAWTKEPPLDQFKWNDFSCYLGEDNLSEEIQLPLSRMNDAGFNFLEIADWIDKNVE